MFNQYGEDIGKADMLITKDGKVVYERNFPKGTGQKKVKVASAAKWLSAATVLAVVDEGKIQLDEPIGKYLPQFKGDKAKMTIRQLLSHTSGLPTNSIYIKNKTLDLKASVDKIATMKLNAMPGAEFNYGGNSFQVAARVVEVITGKSWETLFKEKIADPCGMTNTDFGNKAYKNIGDGAYGTAGDYMKFLHMVLHNGTVNGRRVLSTEMVEEMISDQTGDIPVGYTPYRFTSAQNSRYYGLGTWLDRIQINDDIATEISSQGARGFTPWINTCKGVAAVFATYGDLKELQPMILEAKEVVANFYQDDCNDIATIGLNDGKLQGNITVYKGQKPANISFSLSGDNEVSLKLFDPLGNELESYFDGILKAGSYSFPVDASDLNPGVYFYKLRIGDNTETRKLTIE